MAEEKSPDVAGSLGTVVRPGSLLPRDQSQGLFPFEAFSFDPEQTASPVITLNSPWKLAAAAWVSGTASALAAANAVVPLGAIAFETDTLSFKIGDGSTAYNSLTYVYRGLPVSGEPSLGTPHPRIADHTTWFVAALTPGAGVWSTVTFTVPAGTKMVKARTAIVSVGGDDARWRPYGSGATFANSYDRCLASIPGAGTQHCPQVELLLDSSGRVDVATSSATGQIYIGYPVFYSE